MEVIQVAAGIVLYNPDINRLKENISAVIAQCGHLYLVDNASDNFEDVSELLKNYEEKTTIIRNDKNEGIAKALNQLCSSAMADRYEWILTLDQDSVCPQDMVKKYIRYVDDEAVGMLCPQIFDRNKGTGEIAEKEGLLEVCECITSGSMLRLTAWNDVCGFDESMFIDGVDFDICHRLRHAGFKLMRVQSVVLVHELGHIAIRRFLVWKVIVKNHSPFRKYYIARNTIYLARKEHTSLIKALLQNIKLLFINWGYEKEKSAKTMKIIKGTLDGLSCPVKR